MADALPLYLTDQTEDVIRQRMLDSISDEWDKSEGSYIYDPIAAQAIELAMANKNTQEMLRRAFASTTFGAYLDDRCDEHGLTRLAAVAATGQITFTGTAGTVVPAGTQVATPSDPNTGANSIVFTTNADVTLTGGSGSVGITAQTAAAAGNVPAGAITLLLANMPAVTGVTNSAATTGGLDVESDSALLNRYYIKVRSPSAGGNKADYVNWAMSIVGVGGASVIPVENGPGTVSIYIIDTNKAPASSTLVTSVQNYISPGATNTGDGVAPIGATPTVYPATAVVVNISATLTISTGYDATSVHGAVTDALNAYIKSLAFLDSNDVIYTKVGQTILSTAGITDYANLTINGGTANIAVDAKSVAIPGTVTLS